MWRIFLKTGLTGIGLAALAWLLIYILKPHVLRMPMPDESTLIYESWRTSRGQLPYRDFFQFIGPGTYYWTSALIHMFGLSMLALRVSMLFVLAASLFLTLRMGRAFLPSSWLWVLGLFSFMVYVPASIEIQHHHFSTLMALAAVWQLFCLPKGHTDRKRLWLAGFFVGLAAMFTQSLGGLIGLALGLFLLVYHRYRDNLSWPGSLKAIGRDFILPALAPLLAVCLFFASQSALPDLYYATVGWLLEGRYAQTTSHWYMLDVWAQYVGVIHQVFLTQFPALLTNRLDIPVHLITLLLQGFLPIIGLLWALQVFFGLLGKQPLGSLRGFGAAQWRLLLITMAAYGFFAANFSYPTSYMIAMHGWLPYLLACLALNDLCHRYLPLRQGIHVGILVLFSLKIMIMGFQAHAAYQLPGLRSYGTVEKRLSPMNLKPAELLAVNQLIDFVHHNTRPDQSIFIYNLIPEFYILTDRHNPTRHQMLMALYNSPAQIEEAAADVRKAKPVFILYNQLDRINFRYDLRFRKLRDQGYDYRLYPIEKVLETQYVLAGQMGNIKLYQRKDTLAAGP